VHIRGGSARDRAAAFTAFCRVLRPGGAAVVSTQHPVMDWLRKGGSYFQTTLETDLWHTPAGDQPVRLSWAKLRTRSAVDLVKGLAKIVRDGGRRR